MNLDKCVFMLFAIILHQQKLSSNDLYSYTYGTHLLYISKIPNMSGHRGKVSCGTAIVDYVQLIILFTYSANLPKNYTNRGGYVQRTIGYFCSLVQFIDVLLVLNSCCLHLQHKP